MKPKYESDLVSHHGLEVAVFGITVKNVAFSLSGVAHPAWSRFLELDAHCSAYELIQFCRYLSTIYATPLLYKISR